MSNEIDLSDPRVRDAALRLAAALVDYYGPKERTDG